MGGVQVVPGLARPLATGERWCLAPRVTSAPALSPSRGGRRSRAGLPSSPCLLYVRSDGNHAVVGRKGAGVGCVACFSEATQLAGALHLHERRQQSRASPIPLPQQGLKEKDTLRKRHLKLIRVICKKTDSLTKLSKDAFTKATQRLNGIYALYAISRLAAIDAKADGSIVMEKLCALIAQSEPSVISVELVFKLADENCLTCVDLLQSLLVDHIFRSSLFSAFEAPPSAFCSVLLPGRARGELPWSDQGAANSLTRLVCNLDLDRRLVVITVHLCSLLSRLKNCALKIEHQVLGDQILVPCRPLLLCSPTVLEQASKEFTIRLVSHWNQNLWRRLLSPNSPDCNYPVSCKRLGDGGGLEHQQEELEAANYSHSVARWYTVPLSFYMSCLEWMK